ncbi:MAG: radical SAM protein, partial [Candidatus Wallbacteria bacterium]|nr:radical SAM protein [Candidatus Wallbacteria bacterium]
KPSGFIEDLDSLPEPAWDLVSLSDYAKLPPMNGMLRHTPYATIVSSRGCPFGCTYCHRTMGRGFRSRSPQSVLREIENLVSVHKAREIHFIDDCFNLDLHRAKEICRAIIASGLKISIAFPNAIKGDMVDRELVALLKQAGCYSVTLAVENVSPRMREVMNKSLDLKKLRTAVNLFDKAEILTTVYFIYGFPGETEDDLKLNQDFALKLKSDTTTFFRFIPYPGCELFDRFYHDLKISSIPSREFHFFTESGCFNRSRIPAETLASFRRKFYRSYFSDPKRLLRIARKLPKTLPMLMRLPREALELVLRAFGPGN